MSKPSVINDRQGNLFRNLLSQQLNPKHPLFQLSQVIDWTSIEKEFGKFYAASPGHPPKPVRLMTGLLMLQHMEGLSDERVVELWIENPYWQYFCGYDELQWEKPINPSSLTRWRKRLGKEGIEKILSTTVVTSLKIGHTEEKDCSQVIADTTVMEKAIAYPLDSKLLHKARRHLVDLAKEAGITLRQTYTRLGRAALRKAASYGHAKQYKRMAKQVKKLRGFLGRVVRDVERKALGVVLSPKMQDILEKAHQLLNQTKSSKNKLYSLHAPEVECIAKGKAHKRYEFGCKMALVITHKQGLALSAQALHDNPYDGHTLQGSLNHSEKISGIAIETAFADLGYKGHEVSDKQVILARQKGLSPKLKRALKRRNSIEPHIGHMKTEGKLGRNWLKGILGDQLNALLCAIGHNMRLLRAFLFFILAFLRQTLKSCQHQLQDKITP
ncbi:MAG: IS5 family transposase [Alphaproteobacteria bacterium]|nr:IS5 family transposase [Alphaproteobacteria bacterium]